MTVDWRRILWVDFSASLVSRVMLALWAFAAVGLALMWAPWPEAAATGAQATRTLGSFTAVYTAFALPFLGWRILHIQKVFRVGRRVDGVVEDVSLEGGRGSVAWTYEVDGHALQGSQTLRLTDQVRALQEGESVAVVVDPERPSRSFLVPLYSS